MAVAVIYRWRAKPGRDDDFVRAWSQGTRAIHAKCASFGARLHRAADGTWVSYARWPSEAARQACFRDNDFEREGFAAMRDTIEEMLPEIVMEIVDDQLDEPGD